jgi:hypothetical protein
VVPSPHRPRTYVRVLCAAVVCAVAVAACGSAPGARPGGDTTTATATTVQSAESTTTSIATTRPPPTTAAPLSPPVTAALGGPLAMFRRADVPLSFNAPVNLVAASPKGIVAMGWRAIGAYSQSASTVFSADGAQWRAVTTPWDDNPSSGALPRSFGAPRALAYGGGMFLSVGERVDLAADSKQTSNAIAARLSDGLKWETIDLKPSLGSLHPAQLIRFGDQWIMVVESWDDPMRRETPLYSSVDGSTWDRLATLDFQLLHLRSTSFGLFATGSRAENRATQSVAAASIDGRTWIGSVLNLSVTSPFNRCSSTAIVSYSS